MVKKEDVKESSHKGLLGWSIGLLSVIFSIIQPIAGLIFGIAGIIIANKVKGNPSEWSKTGRKLSMLGIIISVIMSIIAFVSLVFISNNPELLAQINTGY